MFQRLIVPVDGSPSSLAAVPVAARMVTAVDGELEVVTIVDRLGDVALAAEMLAEDISTLGELPVIPSQLVIADDDLVPALAAHVESKEGSMVLMSSHGHGRSAAVLGSTGDALLRAIFGPVIVIGPNAADSSGQLGGRYVVPLDGSTRADAVLPIVAAWMVEFGGTPWLVEVVDNGSGDGPADMVESSFVARRAHTLTEQTGRGAEYEVLHGGHPARAVVRFADAEGASLVFLATHGRTGLDRLRMGSVAAEVVRHAACPVVLFRPPELRHRVNTRKAGS